jgi:hypothetical protein
LAVECLTREKVMGIVVIPKKKVPPKKKLPPKKKSPEFEYAPKKGIYRGKPIGGKKTEHWA